LLGAASGSSCSGGDGGAPGEKGPAQATTAAAVSPTQYLRQLSFDLRGRPPSAEEYESVAAAGEVPAAMIDEMLQSPEFLDQVRAWHSQSLWPNIERYRLQAVGLSGVIQDPNKEPGQANNNYDASFSPDPTLVVDEEARATHVVAFKDEGLGGYLRGGGHAQGNHFCDLRDEAEYPDPSVVGTPANTYTVPADRSGTGQSYTATYYSEAPESKGLVLPIQDYIHCPNYCHSTAPACAYGEISPWSPDANGDQQNDCFRDMDTPGDDPAGRHTFDIPGMRCADGWEREINACDFWEVQANGNPFRPQRKKPGGMVTAFNSQKEGWRWAEHYWSKGVKLKTCAIEAQEREHGMLRKTFDGQPVRCDDAISRYNTVGDPSCGCGPKGAYCQASHRAYRTKGESRAEFRLRSAMEQEPLRIMESVVDRDEDYLSIFTTRRSFVNGPLAFAWRHQTHVLTGEGALRITGPAPSDPQWDQVPYESDDWVEVERPERHAGLLTTLEFLVRFPTHRARIAQYRRQFLCSTEFDYAPAPNPEDTNPDIAVRSGCASCHFRLETDGMWFGRYPDRSGLYLDPEAFPIQNPACQYCSGVGGNPSHCSLGAENPHVPGGVVTDPALWDTCRAYYTNWDWTKPNEAQEPYAGQLWPTLYRNPEHFVRIDEGPAGMVKADLAAGNALQTCAVRRVWWRLVRRDLSADELSTMTSAFEKAGRKYRDLVRSVVTSEPYRTVH
jgi:hypothetical protein